MLKKGWPLVFIFVIIVLIALGYLIFWQIQVARNIQLEEKVLAAPAGFFLNVSESKSIEYFGHSITVNYISSSPTQKIEVVVDGEKRVIEREPIACETSCGEYWNVGDLYLKIEPVTWIKNPEGELVWSFENWNTTEIYFEANFAGGPAGGDKKL